MFHRRKPEISILVPFRPDHGSRSTNWRWLKKYWKHELPEAEIVIGHDYWQPFSKTSALNDAARKARGDIFVLLDADVFLDGDIIREAASRIRVSEEKGYPLWFVPYRRAYRLRDWSTLVLLDSDPTEPERFPEYCVGEHEWLIESPTSASYGHRYGAMIQIMSRTAFETVGGMDCRFRGWGSEDVSFMRAVDTLYGKHKTLNRSIYHLSHFKIGDTYQTREWADQERSLPNSHLAMRYYRAIGDRSKMRALANEGLEACRTPNLLERLIEAIRCVRFW